MDDETPPPPRTSERTTRFNPLFAALAVLLALVIVALTVYLVVREDVADVDAGQGSHASVHEVDPEPLVRV